MSGRHHLSGGKMTSNTQLLHSFHVTNVLECIADPNKNRVIAEFSDRVDAVFPYLNAVIHNLMYNPGANTVTMKREWRILTFYPHVAIMAKVDGVEDAVAQLRSQTAGCALSRISGRQAKPPGKKRSTRRVHAHEDFPSKLRC